MISVSRSILKSFFTAGSKPTSAQFNTLIDSTINYSEDKSLLGLKNYNPALIYVPGDTVLYNQIIYQAKNTTIPGAFNINDWDKIAGGVPGSVTYKGTWNASANTPNLSTISKVKGDYYVVSVAGSTSLNTPPNVINDWEVGDWAIYNGTVWEKIDNSDSVTDGENVAGSGAAIYKGKADTILEFKRLTSIDGSLDLADGTDSVDLGIQFGDSGTSASRAWSAFKINEELNEREPANPNIQLHIADVTTNPHNVTKAQVGLGNVNNTKVNFAGISDPSAANDASQGYSIGSTWINTVDETEFTCMDATNGAAIWQKITANPNIQAHIANMSNPHNTTKAQVGLSNVENVKVNRWAITNPSPSNDDSEGYTVGSTWINLGTHQQYLCVDSGTGAAIWVEITPNPNIQEHIADMDNPHNTTKAQVGLGNADNTADMDKPVSTAQAAADAAVLTSANTYADSLVVGLLNDRGNYDASVNTFPTTGGSGTSGAIKKGDLWTITAPGILGGQDVEIGDMIRALMNTPGQTSSKWAISQNNIGYVAENSANKVNSLSASSTNVQYPGAKLVYDQLAAKEPAVTAAAVTDFWSGTKTFRNLATDVRAVVLTGLSLATGTAITASNTVLQAFGLLQKQVTTNLTTLTTHTANVSNPHSVTKAQVGLGNVLNTKVNSTTTDPTVSSDGTQGYSIGSTWINTSSRKQFVCLDITTGAAVWKELTNPDVPTPVFGSNYMFTELNSTENTTGTDFVPFSSLTLEVPAFTGNFRIQWATISGTDLTMGQFRLVDITDPVSPIVIGQTLSYQSANSFERVPLGGFNLITMSGVARNFTIQYRAVGTPSMIFMYSGKIELYKVSA